MGTDQIKNYEIVCAGDLCADLLIPCRPDKKILYRCAGSVGNTVQVLGKMKQHPIFITPIGNDQNGKFLRREMEACNVNMDYSFEMDKGNMYCLAVLDEQGERTMFSWIPPWGGYPIFKKSDFSEELYGKTSIVFSSGMSLVNETESALAVLEFFERMKQNGSVLIFDLNIRSDSYGFDLKRRELFERMLHCADVILGSGLEEFGLVTGADTLKEAALKLYSSGKCIVARDGKEPVLVTCDEGSFTVPVPGVNPVCTVGAGDTFDAAFLAAYRAELPIRSCVEFAGKVAGYMISHTGHLEIPDGLEEAVKEGGHL